MGKYLNPGKVAFEEAIRSDVFVDKTPMLAFLNSVVGTPQKFVSVSRPRRFGKTMAISMMCAYYGYGADSYELFSQREIVRTEPILVGGDELPWDAYLGAFDVVRVVMTDFFKRNTRPQDALVRLQKLVARDIVRCYPDADFFDQNDLIQTMEDAYFHTGRRFVVLVDEWDAVFRMRKQDQVGQEAYLDFMRDWLKDKEFLALAYITGILPIKKYGEHSALNMFDEYSMTSPKSLAEYAGFTSDDVSRICEQKGLRFDAMRDWYDGYRLSNRPSKELVDDASVDMDVGHVYEIYAPLSVVSAARYRRLENYWSRTETYEALAEYIRLDFDGLKEAVALLMDGGRLRVDTSTYQNDMATFHSRDDVLSLLVHLGYLGFDDEREEVFVPNREIMGEFASSTKTTEWHGTFAAYERSKELCRATLSADAERVAELLEEAHDEAANRTYNDEAALSYAIQLAYYAARRYYTTVLELDSGKGYADVVYLPAPDRSDLPAIVVELKYDKDAHTAMDQIKRRRYPQRLEHYRDNMLLVGINYDKDATSGDSRFKHHTCVIEPA